MQYEEGEEKLKNPKKKTLWIELIRRTCPSDNYVASFKTSERVLKVHVTAWHSARGVNDASENFLQHRDLFFQKWQIKSSVFVILRKMSVHHVMQEWEIGHNIYLGLFFMQTFARFLSQQLFSLSVIP